MRRRSTVRPKYLADREEGNRILSRDNWRQVEMRRINTACRDLDWLIVIEHFVHQTARMSKSLILKDIMKVHI